jgi:hypothetical protein
MDVNDNQGGEHPIASWDGQWFSRERASPMGGSNRRGPQSVPMVLAGHEPLAASK